MNAISSPVFANRRLLKGAVLLTSLTQALSPLLSSLNDRNSFGQVQYTDPKITPAGYAFAVWGFITTLSWLYGFYQLGRGRKNEALHLQVAPWLIGIYLCFSLWLFAAERQWLIATVLIFVAMYFLLAKILRYCLAKYSQLTFADKILLAAQIGIYAGWTAVAIFANSASTIKYYGFSDSGTTGLTWQAVLLFLATINILIGIHLFNGYLPFILTTLWAVVGIYVGLQDENDVEILKVLTLFLGAAVVTYAVGYKYKQSKLPSNLSAR